MQKFVKLGICCMPFVILMLVVTRIVVANTLATSGEKLRQIDIKIANIQEENELLSQEVASLSALVALEARAKELGFVEPTKQQVMTIVQDQFPFALQ